MEDERRGLMSASNRLADELCPGRHNAQEGLPEEHSDDATSGTETHAGYAGETVELGTSQQKVLELARQVDAWVMEQWNPKGEVSETSEERFWLYDSNLNPIYSGKLDKVWFDEYKNRALICDLKSLYGDHEPADSNLQIRTQAALLYEYSGTGQVWAYINQPLRTLKPTIAVFGQDELEDAVSELHALCDRNYRPDAQRIPGHTQCHHCRARSTCPEALALSLVPLSKPVSWELLDSRQKRDLYDRAKLAKSICEKIESAVREDMEKDPECIPGLTFGKARKVPKINDVNGVFNSWYSDLTSIGASPEQATQSFVGAVKPTKEKLVESYAELAHTETISEAEKAVQALLDPYTTHINAKAPIICKKT